MIRKLTLLMAAALLLAAGCGGGLSPDSEIEGEIGSDAAEIGDEWDDAEEELLALGRPVEDDWPCMTWRLSGDGAVLVEVESDDFDPVLAVYGEDGEILALCDDWDGDLEESLIALESVPEGATLMLFGAEGDDGEFELECTVASEDDLEEFALACDLSDGVLEGYKPDDKHDDLLEDLLDDALEDQVYKEFSNARAHGFSVDEPGAVRVALQSEDFDTYLVLLEVDGDDLYYIDYDDDSGPDMNSALMADLEEGRYLAVVLSYTEGDKGDYRLEVQTLDDDLIEPDPVSADEPGVNYRYMITVESPIVHAYVEDTEVSMVTQLSSFSPVAAFEFTVDEAGIYQLDGFAEATDVVLSVWEVTGETTIFVDQNDDGLDTGTDSRLMTMLQSGEYLALVSSYSGGAPDEELGFSWQPAEQEVGSLRLGRVAEAAFDHLQTDIYYSFEVEEPGQLVITADAVTADIDPYIELWSPREMSYSDDDGGDEFNSRLEVQVAPGETGEWMLHVTTFGGREGRIRVLARHTPGGTISETPEMPEPDEPPAEGPPVTPGPGSAGI